MKRDRTDTAGRSSETMAEKQELPYVTMLTDDEVAQAICNYTARRYIGVDPENIPVKFKVTYRNVKQPDGSQRLYASIVITDVGATGKPSEEERK